MASITLRSVKGSPLTNTEVDNNFSNLNNFKVEKTSSTGSAVIPAGTTAQQDGSPSAGYFRYNTENDQFEGYYSTGWAPISSGAGIYTKITTNTLAEAGGLYLADTSGGTFTLTLPATPSAGDSVQIADGADWAANNLTVARNGSTIEGLSDNVTLDIGEIIITFMYDGATWQIFTQAPGQQGPIGYTGSQGTTGFVGSAGTNGFTGSIGYTGSQGEGTKLAYFTFISSI